MTHPSSLQLQPPRSLVTRPLIPLVTSEDEDNSDLISSPAANTCSLVSVISTPPAATYSPASVTRSLSVTGDTSPSNKAGPSGVGAVRQFLHDGHPARLLAVTAAEIRKQISKTQHDDVLTMLVAGDRIKYVFSLS